MRDCEDSMFVGIVRIELHLPAAASLKDKRSVVRAVAEVDHQDLWQRATLGVTVVSGERRQIDMQLQAVRNIVEAAPQAQVLDWQEQCL